MANRPFVRPVSVVSVIALLAALSGCSSSSGSGTADALASDASSSDSGETIASDVAVPDTVTTDSNGTDATCRDVRKLGDHKQPTDACWDPPLHYCSGGIEPLYTVGCASDSSFCCQFSSSCIPCGFIECACSGGTCIPAGCDAIPMITDAVKCHKPDSTLAICWDGVDAK